jgi:hypothetical protein
MKILIREYNQAKSGLMVDSASQPSHRIQSDSIPSHLIPSNLASFQVLTVDGRATGPDLAAGIVRAIADLEQRDFAGMWTGVRQEFEKCGGAQVVGNDIELASGYSGLGMVIRSVLSMFSAKVHKETKTPEQAIEDFVVIAEAQGRFPVLFVGEANLAFSSEGYKSNNKAVLALLTRLTKQEQQLNVVLGSSEHACPFRLKEDFAFNLVDINTIFAGEVPLERMRELLTKQWGLGERLAECWLAAYGGHVYRTYMAISSSHGLSLRKEKFKAEDATPAVLCGECEACIKAEEHQPGTIELLREVAVHGWAPLDDVDDPRAKLLSLKKVAGVVNSRSLVVGLPVDVWGRGAKHGLVAASQLARAADDWRDVAPPWVIKDISRGEVKYRSAF